MELVLVVALVSTKVPLGVATLLLLPRFACGFLPSSSSVATLSPYVRWGDQRRLQSDLETHRFCRSWARGSCTGVGCERVATDVRVAMARLGTGAQMMSGSASGPGPTSSPGSLQSDNDETVGWISDCHVLSGVEAIDHLLRSAETPLCGTRSEVWRWIRCKTLDWCKDPIFKQKVKVADLEYAHEGQLHAARRRVFFSSSLPLLSYVSHYFPDYPCVRIHVPSPRRRAC